MFYTIKTWTAENSEPVSRHGLPWGVCFALATRGGYAKAQVICAETSVIEIETKAPLGQTTN